MHDVQAPPGEPITSPDEVASPRGWQRRGSDLAWSLATIALGTAAVIVGALGSFGENALVRTVIVLAGLGVVYRGLQGLTRWIFGPRFELSFWVSAAWLIVIVVAAALANWLPLAESRQPAFSMDEPILAGPSLLSRHPLGTDRFGLDILGGVLFGARVSLVVGVGATVIGMAVGSLLGLISGFYRKGVATAISLFTDAMLAFPTLILLMAMVAVLQPSVVNVTIALGVVIIPVYVRLSRANTLRFAERDFVTAARTLGDSNGKVLRREILPNVAPPVASYSFLVLASIIVAEASLSFLGLSVRRPNPTWGNMIASGQSEITRNPHLVFGPGIALFITVYALNVVGERARSAWDPRDAKL
ncbi:MAG: ABC transporter permease [Desertimonas sp.]